MKTVYIETSKDEIIKEVWRAKDAIAAKYKHNAIAMAKGLRDRGKKSSVKVVNLRASHQTTSRAAK